MPSFILSAAAVLTELPRDVRLQIVSPGSEPPEGDGWLHETSTMATGCLRFWQATG